MRQILAALFAGALFGLGLTVSRMIDPAKVLGFLDVAGSWDPSLAPVLAGAAGTAAIGYRLMLGRARPMLADSFALPTRPDIDLRLLGGAALFGVGWDWSACAPGRRWLGSASHSGPWRSS